MLVLKRRQYQGNVRKRRCWVHELLKKINTLGEFHISLFRSEKSQNLMREGGKKKHLRKKNIKHIFGKGNEGDQIKKHWTYFWKS